MKVLHILNHSAPQFTGYTFRTLSLLEGMRGLGVETVHLTSSKQQGAPAGDADEQEGLLFNRTAPGLLGSLPILGQLDVSYGLSKRLDTLIVREKPDLLHAHSPALTGLAALWAGKKHKLPVVYEIRAFWEDAGVDQGKGRTGDLRYRVMRRLETSVARGADAVVTICNGLRDDMLERGIPAGKLHVVPNGVDPAVFQASPEAGAAIRERHGLEGAEVLGFFGTFFRFEGLALLLDAVRRLAAGRPRLRVLLAGDGEQDAELRALAKQPELASRVVFAGRVPQDEIPAFYQAADLMVYPRRSLRITELVTPLKPLEAMAAGRAVLASDVGGHRELIENGVTGVFFRKDDPEDLARCIGQLLEDEPLRKRLGAAGCAWVEKDRRWSVLVRKDLEIYRQVLGLRR